LSILRARSSLGQPSICIPRFGIPSGDPAKCNTPGRILDYPVENDRLGDRKGTGRHLSIKSLFGLLWRQKLIVIPVALISILACVAVLFVSPTTYRASGAVVLLNPPALPEVTEENPTIPPEFQNPYSRFGDLSVMVDILVRVLETEQMGKSLKAAGLDGTFEIAANRDFYRGPIVDVAAEGPSAEAAIRDANLVIAEIGTQLRVLQEQQGTAESYFIQVETIVVPDKATTVFSGTLRSMIIVAGLGVVATLAAGLLAEKLRRPRNRRAEPVTDVVNAQQ